MRFTPRPWPMAYWMANPVVDKTGSAEQDRCNPDTNRTTLKILFGNVSEASFNNKNLKALGRQVTFALASELKFRGSTRKRGSYGKGICFTRLLSAR